MAREKDFSALNERIKYRHVIVWLVSQIPKSFSGFGETARELILLKLGVKTTNLAVLGNSLYVQPRYNS
jgi:hypothetical protein